MSDADDRTEAVKLLYGVTVSDISEFKARQWEVTKWAIAVILAFIIPHALGDANSRSGIVGHLGWVGLGVGCWACLVILRLQRSLRSSRLNLDRYRNEWPALGSAYGKPKRGHTKFLRDWDVWLFQILLIVAAMIVLLAATRP